jgi:hypothetical protein
MSFDEIAINSSMLVARYEAVDFRDREEAREAARRQPGFWDHFGFLGSILFIGITVWNVLTLGGWLSDHYAKKRMERAGYSIPWKRSHIREWDSP